MPDIAPKKIAYLFGAGATHAELADLYPALIEQDKGLLISQVSKRVIDRARRNRDYLKGLETVSAATGSLNIELLITLIESSKIHGWEEKTRFIRELVQNDIEGILTKPRVRSFYLHKALLELHKRLSKKRPEQLIGVISLNYDDVLDRAFEEIYYKPNYCFSLGAFGEPPSLIPLLKLHGSFNWVRQRIRGKQRTIEIIPMGATKNYLHAPYGFIWSRAMQILIECDVLRVIGCSLSQNDVHLIDLLFKAHLERSTAFEMEIVDSQEAGERIRQNYGFFRNIRTLTEIRRDYEFPDVLSGEKGGLVSEPRPSNAFKMWLISKTLSLFEGNMNRTKYLKMIFK